MWVWISPHSGISCAWELVRNANSDSWIRNCGRWAQWPGFQQALLGIRVGAQESWEPLVTAGGLRTKDHYTSRVCATSQNRGPGASHLRSLNLHFPHLENGKITSVCDLRWFFHRLNELRQVKDIQKCIIHWVGQKVHPGFARKPQTNFLVTQYKWKVFWLGRVVYKAPLFDEKWFYFYWPFKKESVTSWEISQDAFITLNSIFS